MKLIQLLLLLSILFLAACTSAQNRRVDQQKKSLTPPDWFDIELTDVNTADTFTISEFKGKDILIESFAIWCPTCTKQQIELRKLHELNPDVISISIDTDPNEDESKVLAHTQKNEFDWKYSVSPEEFTKALIDEFGVGIVNAPAVPVIQICEDQTFKLLGRGVKSAKDLNTELKVC